MIKRHCKNPTTCDSDGVKIRFLFDILLVTMVEVECVKYFCPNLKIDVYVAPVSLVHDKVKIDNSKSLF